MQTLQAGVSLTHVTRLAAASLRVRHASPLCCMLRLLASILVERQTVQKRTFTRWINLHLKKCDQPIEVQDLFQEIQDGRILMALLEELSGCKLLHGFKKSSHRIFRLNNIAKVLAFLEERNVKLVSIDAADVADGNSSIILGLIWNIILFFQIKELTGNIRSQFPSTSSLSSIAGSSDPAPRNIPLSETAMVAASTREDSKAIKKLLQWVQKRTRRYGVAVQDFGKSWTNGLAFLAVIKSIDPSLVDMRKALLRNARENLEDAFRIAHYSLGIPRLLEPEDVTSNAPDEQSIMTYVSQFLEHFPGTEEPKQAYPLIERSTSMGRLNFRNADLHHLVNNAHSGRVKDRFLMFQKDSAQPPSKILCSSMSEDRGGMSPAIKPAMSRTWFSEDFLADSPFTKDSLSSVEENLKEPTEDVSTSSMEDSQLNDPHSPIDSTLPELVTTESVMGDSAINSPDSWVESEECAVPVKSQSDSLLYDCTTPWDVYRAIPVKITTVDGGFVHLAEKVLDDQSMAESFIDEGVFSLNSLSSMQDEILGTREKKVLDNDMVKEKNEVNLESHKDFSPKPLKELELDNEREKTDCHYQQIDASYCQKEEISIEESPFEKSSSFGGGNQPESDDSNQFQNLSKPEPQSSSVQKPGEKYGVTPSCSREDKCLEQPTDPLLLVDKGPFNDQTNRLQGENVGKGLQMENECHKTHNSQQIDEIYFLKDEESLKEDAGLVKLSSFGDDVLLERDEPQAYSDQEFKGQYIAPPSSYGESLKQAVDTCQVIEGEFDCENNHEEVLPFKDECKNTESLLQDRGAEADGVVLEGTEAATVTQNEAIDGARRCCPDLPTDLSSENQYEISQISSKQYARTDTRSQTPGQDRTTRPSDERLLPAEKAPVCCEAPETSRKTEEELGRCTSTEDIACDFNEPMDLFYPYKEENVFTEPLDNEMQSWPSVLTVSALEPAPASKMPPEDQPLCAMEDNFLVDLLHNDNKAEKDSTSAPGEPRQLPGLMGAFPITYSDGSQDSFKEITESGSFPSSHDSPSQEEEVLVPPVLRHRKGLHLCQPTSQDNGVNRTTKQNMDNLEPCWSDSWEPYLLLVAWIVLFCVMLLPQMDVKI
ncbi:interaptin isoform X3 [Nerophis ophidion]|uniref:interaptin isoform X3 n=1 Tax=Nerophis ophidion TaxID=159077 RepID=UPI002ADF9718|nr:interaptin isoform X3 [Nerophis ophidion]